MLIDTHCHLGLLIKPDFNPLKTDEEFQEAHYYIEQAKTHDVKRIIEVGTTKADSYAAVRLAHLYTDVYAAIGIHPNDVSDQWLSDWHELNLLAQAARHKKIVAFGECGIDKHYPEYKLERQKDAFRAQINSALEYDLALIIHTRDAEHETLMCLDEFKHEPLRGVVHCFSGNHAFAQEIVARKLKLGIGGTITYPKNEHLRDVVKTYGLHHIVLETDAPFLPPQIIRGKKNSPAQIKTIAHYVATLLQTSLENVALTTTANACELFRFDEFISA